MLAMNIQELSDSTDERNTKNSNSNSLNDKFPARLYAVLEEAEEKGLSDVISWTNDGHSFMVYDHDKFLHFFLTKNFRISHYKSFNRQLSFYGFKRCRRGPNKGSYSHRNFIRGKPNLCHHIKRQQCIKVKAEDAPTSVHMNMTTFGNMNIPFQMGENDDNMFPPLPNVPDQCERSSASVDVSSSEHPNSIQTWLPIHDQDPWESTSKETSIKNKVVPVLQHTESNSLLNTDVLFFCETHCRSWLQIHNEELWKFVCQETGVHYGDRVMNNMFPTNDIDTEIISLFGNKEYFN